MAVTTVPARPLADHRRDLRGIVQAWAAVARRDAVGHVHGNGQLILAEMRRRRPEACRAACTRNVRCGAVRGDTEEGGGWGQTEENSAGCMICRCVWVMRVYEREVGV
jgi:hypothetical protein